MQTYKELIDSQFPDCNIVSVYLQFYKLLRFFFWYSGFVQKCLSNKGLWLL
jgi:hypothetical protein